MKRIITVLMVLLPFAIFAQEKHDNQIIVTPLIQENIFENSINVLSDNGYVFTFTDGTLEYTISGPIRTKGGYIVVYMNVYNNKITLNAKLYSDTLGYLNDVEMIGASNSPTMKSWETFVLFAKLLGTCEYRKVGAK